MNDDYLKYVATIKHTFTGPTGSSMCVDVPKGCNGPSYGDGNVMSFSLPKEHDCNHGFSKFLCVRCVGRQTNIGNIPVAETSVVGGNEPSRGTLRFGYITPITTEPSVPDYWAKMGPSSSLPLSWNATSGTYSDVRPQFLTGPASYPQDVSKSDGLRIQLPRTFSFDLPHSE